MLTPKSLLPAHLWSRQKMCLQVRFVGRCLRLKVPIYLLFKDRFVSAPIERTMLQSYLLSRKTLIAHPGNSVHICPITCSGIIKLVFVRGCNYQLPWHIPSLVVCTLPQYRASNRRKHSLTTLKMGKKMAENRVPLCSSLWSESCFTFLLVQAKRRKSIPKPHCFQAPAV